MYLPPPGTYRRGPKHEPLINVPPPEDPLLHFLTSMVMNHGKRATARRRVAKALLNIHTLTRAPPLPILREAVQLVSPAVRIRTENATPTKIASVPIALTERQPTRLGIKWLLEAAKQRTSGQRIRLEERLAREVIITLKEAAGARDKHSDDVKYTGALAEREKMHKFATVNR
ncbi:ribosomal protein S7 domain-containing protein [Mycena crocata]|nr:ribosomal protein S7 domain-containing protein [Mycena crocata]